MIVVISQLLNRKAMDFVVIPAGKIRKILRIGSKKLVFSIQTWYFTGIGVCGVIE